MFPFNYVIPGQSTNSMFDFKSYCEQQPAPQRAACRGCSSAPTSSARATAWTTASPRNSYRVVHFVVDMPIRLPREMLEQVPPAGWSLGAGDLRAGRVPDRSIARPSSATSSAKPATAAYKERQRQAVMRRLKLGLEEARTNPEVREADPREAEAPDTDGQGLGLGLSRSNARGRRREHVEAGAFRPRAKR